MSEERRKRIKREGKRALLGDTVNFPFSDVCACWGVSELGDEFRSPLHSDVPVLLVCGAYDSRTPVSNALELIPELPNSRLVVVRNAAHDPRLFSSRETVDAVVRFFRDGSVESEIIDMPPFRFIPLGIYR
jgi:pimeloyl-ACP methyl ester carboxylesterase